VRSAVLLILALLISGEIRGDEAKLRIISTVKLQNPARDIERVANVPAVSVAPGQTYEVRVSFDGGSQAPDKLRRVLIYERAGDPNCRDAHCWHRVATFTSRAAPDDNHKPIVPSTDEILVAAWYVGESKAEGGEPTGSGCPGLPCDQFSIRNGAVMIVLPSPHGDTVVSIHRRGTADDR
jgi:hypothetical protein